MSSRPRHVLFAASLFLLGLLALHQVNATTVANVSVHSNEIHKGSDSEWQWVGNVSMIHKGFGWISEGITFDAESGDFFFSAQTILIRVDHEFNVLKVNKTVIPDSLTSKGYNHMGDISYYQGKLYCPLERNPQYNRPALGIWDAQTLEFTGKWRVIDQYHNPWAALDHESGLLYTSDYYNVAFLHVWDLDLQPVKTVYLQQTLDQLQGGSIFAGRLFLTTNINDTVYSVDTNTGAVQVELQSELPWHIEMEGITFDNQGKMYFFGNNQPKGVDKLVYIFQQRR